MARSRENPIDRSPRDRPEGLTHSPFAGLRKADLPVGPGAPADGTPRAGEPDGGAPPGGTIRVRRETKGRAGKTVTRVAGLDLADEALGELARELKRGLGCGAARDRGDLLLQGALTERAAAWLRERLGRPVAIEN